MASRSRLRSRISPSMMLTRPLVMAQERFSRRPRTKLSRTTISGLPLRTSRSAICEPTRPAPPVISTRFMGSALISSFLHPLSPSASAESRASCKRLTSFTPPRPQDLRGNARDDRIIGNILRYHGARSHDGIRTDAHAGKNASVHPDIRAEADRNGLDDQPGRDDGRLHRFAGMGRAQDLGSRAPADIVFDGKRARIHVRLRANPDVIPDFAVPVKAALNHGLRADKNGVAELHCFRVLEHHVRANLEGVTCSLAHGAQENPAHQIVRLTLACPVLRKKRV